MLKIQSQSSVVLTVVLMVSVLGCWMVEWDLKLALVIPKVELLKNHVYALVMLVRDNMHKLNSEKPVIFLWLLFFAAFIQVSCNKFNNELTISELVDIELTEYYSFEKVSLKSGSYVIYVIDTSCASCVGDMKNYHKAFQNLKSKNEQSLAFILIGNYSQYFIDYFDKNLWSGVLLLIDDNNKFIVSNSIDKIIKEKIIINNGIVSYEYK